MQNKLQELTDRLYAEGLSKGKQEGEELVQKAKAEAEQIVNQAKAEAAAKKKDHPLSVPGNGISRPTTWS